MAVQRGEVYFVNLNPVQGREQAGRRPVLVLSVDAINRLPLVVTVVVGTKGESVTRDYPTNVRVSSAESGLPIETVFSVSNCVRWIPAALRVPLQADCRGTRKAAGIQRTQLETEKTVSIGKPLSADETRTFVG